MAEVAVGALAAEQVVATALEVGAAAAVTKPPPRLKGSLSQISGIAKDEAVAALTRSHHSVTIIDNKAYIFGGENSKAELCSTDVQSLLLHSDMRPDVEYACYPAFPLEDARTGTICVPAPRSRHAACARGKYVVIHGGCDQSGSPIDESCLWLWDSESLQWAKIEAVSQIGSALAPRFGHSVFFDEKEDILILHGGYTTQGGEKSKETWLYTFDTLAWTALPPAPSAPTASAFLNNSLYTVSPHSTMSGQVSVLNIGSNATEREKPGALSWEAVSFPINPLTPGPRAREGGALVTVSTGAGRHYLVLIFGAKGESEAGDRPFYSDLWALQLSTHGYSPAAMKDAIRNKIPHVESGEMNWHEVELTPAEQMELEGKAHPGPRGFFGAAAVNAKTVLLWGGASAQGKEGDGWMLRIL